MDMNLETVDNKQLNRIEQLAKDLIEVMRKAKLAEEPIYKELSDMALQVATERRFRFDGTDEKYRGF